MILLSLFSGMFLGAIAAGLTVVSGGSVLLAVLSYSLVGAVGTLLCAAIFAMLDERKADNRTIATQDKCSAA